MLVRVRLLAVFDLAHKIKIVLTTDVSDRRSSDDGCREEGEDERRYHQYQQKSAGFGNGRHDDVVLGRMKFVFCEKEKERKKSLVCILFAHNLFL